MLLFMVACAYMTLTPVCFFLQAALLRQKASVQASEVARHEAYNKQHGSRLTLGHAFRDFNPLKALTVGRNTLGSAAEGSAPQSQSAAAAGAEAPHAVPAPCEFGKVRLASLVVHLCRF